MTDAPAALKAIMRQAARDVVASRRLFVRDSQVDPEARRLLASEKEFV
jgi:hypothetical protein